MTKNKQNKMLSNKQKMMKNYINIINIYYENKVKNENLTTDWVLILVGIGTLVAHLVLCDKLSMLYNSELNPSTAIVDVCDTPTTVSHSSQWNVPMNFYGNSFCVYWKYIKVNFILLIYIGDERQIPLFGLNGQSRISYYI